MRICCTQPNIALAMHLIKHCIYALNQKLHYRYIVAVLSEGPSIKYVTLFWTNLNNLLCHTLSHISGPPKVCHTSRNPQVLVLRAYINIIFIGGFVLVRWRFCRGAWSGDFC